MIRDALFDFNGSTGQALSGTTAVLSTNVYDAGEAINLFGGAEPLRVQTLVATRSGTSPTLRVEVIAADDAALTSNVIVLDDTGTRTVAAGQQLNQLVGGQTTAKRYYGIRYTQGGTTPVHTVMTNLGPSLPTLSF